MCRVENLHEDDTVDQGRMLPVGEISIMSDMVACRLKTGAALAFIN